MRISNQSLAKIFIETDITTNNLVVYFDVIMKLLKKYKKNLLNINFLKIIEENDKNLYSIIKLFIYYNKLDTISIKSISNEIKKQSSDYIPTFTINTIEKAENIEIINKLKSKFSNCDVKKQDGFELGAYISGEGWYYKRNIDQDLQKIL